MTDRNSSNVEAAAYLAREADAGPDPDVPSRAELAAEAHADREEREERERTVHLAGMLLAAEAHVTRALDELERALELRPGDKDVHREGKALMEIAERLGLRAEALRWRVEAQR